MSEELDLRAARARAERDRAVQATGVAAPPLGTIRRRAARRRTTRAALGLACVAVIGTLVVISGQQSEGDPTVVASDPNQPEETGNQAITGEPSAATTTSTTPVPVGWRPIPPAPLAAVSEPAVVWTGREVVVWGGSAGVEEDAAAEGAAYSLATGQWKRLPPAPIAGRVLHQGVWTGKEVIFWGGTTRRFGGDRNGQALADGAAFDPVREQWRPIPAAPIGGRVQHQAVWDGEEVMVWGGSATCCGMHGPINDPEAAAYDPAANRWRRLADVPSPWKHQGGTDTFVVEGRIYLSWDGHIGLYDRDRDRWRQVSEAPPGPEVNCTTSGGPHTVAAATVDQVFTWNGSFCRPLHGAALRLADRTWREVAPLDPKNAAPLVADMRGGIYSALGESGRFVRYDIDQNRWDELPSPELSARIFPYAAWTGRELLIWGGYAAGASLMDGAIFNPGPP